MRNQRSGYQGIIEVVGLIKRSNFWRERCDNGCVEGVGPWIQEIEDMAQVGDFYGRVIDTDNV